jgi:hypothetical protein
MKKYLKFTFVFCFLFVGVVFSINYICDPFWITGKTHFANQHKSIVNERIQKTNLMLNNDIDFDTILLGSSRTTFMDHHYFKHKKVFNYAVSAIYPDEYITFAKIALSRKKYKNLIIGVDFFGTSKNKFFPTFEANNIEFYFNKNSLPLRQNMTLSGLKTVGKNLICSFKKNCANTYDKNFFKILKKVVGKAHIKKSLGELIKFDKLYSSYEFNPHLENIFDELTKLEGIKITLFTTPEMVSFFDILVKTNRFPDYERWIRLCVEKFGGIWDFIGVNSGTANINNYQDAHHFYADSIGNWIIDRLEGRHQNVPADFGVLVTKDNVEEHLQNIRNQALKVDKDPIKTFEKLLKQAS